MSLLDEFAADWRLGNRSPLTLDGYLRTLRRVETCHSLPVDLPTAKAWLADRQPEVAPSTLHTYYRALKSFSRWYADAYDSDDLLFKLRYPKIDQPPPGRIADPREVEILRNSWAADDFDSRRNRAILAVLEATGMRRGELAQLRCDDLDLTSGAAKVTIRKAKNGEGRTAPLSDYAAKVVRGYLKERSRHHSAHLPSLWIGRDGALRTDSITQLFDKQSKRLGIHVSTHQFRRAMSHTWALRGGTDDALMSICGWKSPQMAARYRREAIATLADNQYRRLIG